MTCFKEGIGARQNLIVLALFPFPEPPRLCAGPSAGKHLFPSMKFVPFPSSNEKRFRDQISSARASEQAEGFVDGERANFTGIVLFCIEADFCNCK